MSGDNLIMTLAVVIESTRMNSLLSQDNFAKKLNVYVGSTNRWENEKKTKSQRNQLVLL